jgi:hypothetical protein
MSTQNTVPFYGSKNYENMVIRASAIHMMVFIELKMPKRNDVLMMKEEYPKIEK